LKELFNLRKYKGVNLIDTQSEKTKKNGEAQKHFEKLSEAIEFFIWYSLEIAKLFSLFKKKNKSL